ncbi:MAG: RdgB/HAM1 family non-canonical purine NTP pyrophosphatase [Fibrobacter sp.]|jgi:XTP/dITP diphosphohydrolase|nr:RdgB/HAM1 family non-canonical purine NTP pyrophosphatase [Fibrobacter sp.]
MRKKMVIATENTGKIQEFSKILKDERFEFLSLRDIGFKSSIEETGKTFAENAQIKASAVAEFLQKQNMEALVLADDSGLEVSALNGKPGIYTARYAGVHGDDRANFMKLLHDLKGAPDRNARFVCVLCLIDAPNSVRFFEGECRGSITTEPMGEQGFGYDPVFIPSGHSRTFAQMDALEKKSMSHRGAAIRKLNEYLQTL